MNLLGGGSITRRAALAGLATLPILNVRPAQAANRGPLTARIAIEDNRVWVGVSIGGRPPLLFLIDTGAVVSMVQPSYVERLGLKPGGGTRLVGVGGHQDFAMYEGRDVVFGGAIRQPVAVFAVPNKDLDLAPDVAGLLSAGFLTSVDADLDFAAGEWRAYPEGRPDRAGFRRLSSQIRPAHERARGRASDYIVFDAQMDGRRYRLIADTGAPGQVRLFGDATRRSGLWSDERPYAPMRSRGIGGAAPRGRLVRAGRLDLGPIAFDQPLVSLSQDAHSKGSIDGLIGLALLERLTLSTDLRHDALWAKPNGRPAQPDRYSFSGLWLEERNGKVVIAEISPASPAGSADLKEGDEVLGGSFGELIRRLDGVPGQEIGLHIRRRGDEREIRLVLRDYL